MSMTNKQLDIFIISGSIIGLSLTGFAVGEQFQLFIDRLENDIDSFHYTPYYAGYIMPVFLLMAIGFIWFIAKKTIQLMEQKGI